MIRKCDKNKELQNDKTDKCRGVCSASKQKMDKIKCKQVVGYSIPLDMKAINCLPCYSRRIVRFLITCKYLKTKTKVMQTMNQSEFKANTCCRR